MTAAGRDEEEAELPLLAKLVVFVLALCLILAGVGLLVYAASIRTSLHVTSTTCVLTSSDIGDSPGRREDEPAEAALLPAQAAACGVTRVRAGLRLAQLTEKREPPSDTQLSAILASALALLVCGAFFTRIESVTVGNVVLGIKSRRARRQAGALVEQAALDREEDIPPRVVRRAKVAAGDKAVERVAQMRRGDPLPADVLEELADQALEEELKREQADNPPGG